MSVNKQQASEFLKVIHQQQLSMKEMGLVYSDMGDK